MYLALAITTHDARPDQDDGSGNGHSSAAHCDWAAPSQERAVSHLPGQPLFTISCPRSQYCAQLPDSKAKTKQLEHGSE